MDYKNDSNNLCILNSVSGDPSSPMGLDNPYGFVYGMERDEMPGRRRDCGSPDDGSATTETSIVGHSPSPSGATGGRPVINVID